MVATPNSVELGDGAFHHFGVVCEDARLKISAVGALHANASTREVGRADVNGFQIKDKQFEVYPRANCPFETFGEVWVLIKILTEHRAGLLSMEKSDIYFSDN